MDTTLYIHTSTSLSSSRWFTILPSIVLFFLLTSAIPSYASDLEFAPPSSGPQNASWTPRSKGCIVAIQDTILVAGGYADKFGVFNNDVYRFTDPSTGFGSNIATISFTKRFGHACVNWQNKVWLTAGTDGTSQLNDVWTSSDIGATWSLVGTAPYGQRQYPSLLVAFDKLWLAGGANNPFELWSTSDGSAWEQSTFTGTTIPGVRFQSAFQVLNNQMWLIGGYSNKALNDVYTYDPTSSSWTSYPPFPGTGPNNAESVTYGGTTLHNGKIVIIGGQAGQGGLPQDGVVRVGEATDAFAFDGQTWTRSPIAPLFPISWPMVVSYKKSLYVMGGDTGLGNLYNEIYISSKDWDSPPFVPSSTGSAAAGGGNGPVGGTSGGSSGGGGAGGDGGGGIITMSSSSGVSAGIGGTPPTGGGGGGTDTIHQDPVNAGSGSSSNLLPVVIVVPIVLVLIIACALFAVWMQRRHRREKALKSQEPDVEAAAWLTEAAEKAASRKKSTDIYTHHAAAVPAWNRQQTPEESRPVVVQYDTPVTQGGKHYASGIGDGGGGVPADARIASGEAAVTAAARAKHQDHAVVIPPTGQSLPVSAPTDRNWHLVPSSSSIDATADLPAPPSIVLLAASVPLPASPERVPRGDAAENGVVAPAVAPPEIEGQPAMQSVGVAQQSELLPPSIMLPVVAGGDQNPVQPVDAPAKPPLMSPLAAAYIYGSPSGSLDRPSSLSENAQVHNPRYQYTLSSTGPPPHHPETDFVYTTISKEIGLPGMGHIGTPPEGLGNEQHDSTVDGSATKAANYSDEGQVVTEDPRKVEEPAALLSTVTAVGVTASGAGAAIATGPDSRLDAGMLSSTSDSHSTTSGGSDSVALEIRQTGSLSDSSSKPPVRISAEDTNGRRASNTSNSTSGQATSFLNPAALHRMLHSFEISRDDVVFGAQVGKGGFGTVYKARYRGVDAAVKVIHTYDSADLTKAFERELGIMCSVHNNRLIQIYGVCRDDNQPFICMEYMSRGSLYDVLHGKNKVPLSMELRLQMATQIVEGICYLHNSRPSLIHADVKSHNVLVDSSFGVKLGDFGFAQMMAHTNSSSLMSMRSVTSLALGGTLAYLAPEALSDEPIQPDTTLDMYALGVLLWELFSGNIPWQGLTFTQIVCQVAIHKKTLPMLPIIPIPIQSILKQLFLERNQRPSALKVLDQLQSIEPNSLDL